MNWDSKKKHGSRWLQKNSTVKLFKKTLESVPEKRFISF